LEALHRHVDPVVPANALLTRHLIANLDHDDVKIRDAASRQLARLGDTVVEALERARRGPLTVEARMQIDALLCPKENRLFHDERAWWNIIEMLEQTDSPAAKQLLTRLTRKAPSVRVSREASAAPGRLQRGR
jgi:hypothetical protein